MLEYIFFNKKICPLFEKTAIMTEISPTIDCADECFTVRLPDDLDEVILEKLKNDYDKLMDIDRDLTEQQQDSANDIHAAGITVQLKDGRDVYASVTPELLSKVMLSISTDELNTFSMRDYGSSRRPDKRSLCQG